MTEETVADRRKLSARSVEDLSVVASLLQDAILPLGDMAFLRDERAFVMACNRFRWESDEEDENPERTHAGLRFDSVSEVSYRGICRTDRGQFLSLLTMAYDDGVVVLHFSGGGMIRLAVDELHCVLEDFGEPWPALSTPSHED